MVLALIFAELLAGGVLITSGITGHNPVEVIKGETKPWKKLTSKENSTKESGTQTPESFSELPGPGVGGGLFGSSGYTNPLPKGFTKGQTDQGVDFSSTPGSPILAIGRGKVLGIQSNWYKGQPFLFYELLEGPLAGKVIYIAEQIVPHVKPGQEIRTGQVIATYATKGTGIETGFATKKGETLAMSTTGYKEGEVTSAGKAFEKFLSALGL